MNKSVHDTRLDPSDAVSRWNGQSTPTIMAAIGVICRKTLRDERASLMVECLALHDVVSLTRDTAKHDRMGEWEGDLCDKGVCGIIELRATGYGNHELLRLELCVDALFFSFSPCNNTSPPQQHQPHYSIDHASACR